MRQGQIQCFGDREGKKIGICIADNYAREIIHQYKEVNDHIDMDIDFDLYFFDFDPMRIGHDLIIKGRPVRPVEDIELLRINRVVIASDDYDAIRQRLQKYERNGVELVRYTFAEQNKRLSRKQEKK